jgi:hypothetical protein
LYDTDGLTLADVVALEMPDVQEVVHIRLGFWKAFQKLSESDAEIISLLMVGNKYKDISTTISNARYRIRIAKKRFEAELHKEGISVGKR